MNAGYEYDIFISYARKDEECFVEFIYNTLTNSGMKIWWDRKNMPSRELVFTEAIGQAILSSERFLLFVGSNTQNSDYVSAELEYAQKVGCCVFTILYGQVSDNSDMFGSLPTRLRRSHVYNFVKNKNYERELDLFQKNISEPLSPLAELYGVFKEPIGYVQRKEDFDKLENIMFDSRPEGIGGKSCAIFGMAGSGKSTLAASFCRSSYSRRQFPDGIVWISVKQDYDLLEIWNNVYSAICGGSKKISIEKIEIHLAELLKDKIALIVLDDVWDESIIEIFLNATYGSRTKLLFTTRNKSIATKNGVECIELCELSDEDAYMILSKYGGVAIEDLNKEAKNLCTLVSKLPLAIAICGAMKGEGHSWNGITKAFQKKDRDYIDKRLPNYEHKNVMIALDLSVAILKEHLKGLYTSLVIFPRGEKISIDTLKIYWRQKQIEDWEIENRLTELENKALLMFDRGERYIKLHDLQYDYLSTVSENISMQHSVIVNCYKDETDNSLVLEQKDEYFYKWIIYHLVNANLIKEAERLLFCYKWLYKKLEFLSVNSIIMDCNCLPNKSEHIKILEDFLHLSGHILAEDFRQLPSQLFGRLLNVPNTEIQKLLKNSDKLTSKFWLKPLYPCFTQPNTNLVDTIFAHTGSVEALIYHNDQLISASGDETIKIWRPTDNFCIMDIKGHKWHVTSLATYNNYIISGSWDNTIKIWNPSDGKLLRELTGHKSWIKCLVVYNNLLISGSWDKTIRIWDLKSFECIGVLSGHKGVINCIQISENKLFSSANDRTIKVWNLEKKICEKSSVFAENVVSFDVLDKKILVGLSDGNVEIYDINFMKNKTFTGHTDAVSVVKFWKNKIVSGSWDKKVKIWDIISGVCDVTLSGHACFIHALAFNNDYIFSGDGDGVIKKWKISSEKIQNIEGHSNQITSLAYKNGQLFSGSWDKTVRAWEISDFSKSQIICKHNGKINNIFIKGDNLVTLDENNLKIIEVSSKSIISEVKMSERISSSLAHEDKIILGSENGHLITIDHKNNINDIGKISDCPITTLLIEGDQIFIGTANGEIILYNLETKQIAKTLMGHKDLIRVFVKRGDILISGSDDRTIIMWDLKNDRASKSISDNYISVRSLVESNGLLIVGVADSTLWDIGRGEFLELLETETVDENCLSIYKSKLSSGFDGKKIKIYDLAKTTSYYSFVAEASIESLLVLNDILFAGDRAGNLLVLKMENLSELSFHTNE